MTKEPAGLGGYFPQRLFFTGHLAVFSTIVTIVVLIDIFLGGDWQLFWPIFVWSSLLTVHYLIAKTLSVDSAWVDEKVNDLHGRSYDLDHIQNIQKRVVEKDNSVTPKDMQER